MTLFDSLTKALKRLVDATFELRGDTLGRGCCFLVRICKATHSLPQLPRACVLPSQNGLKSACPKCELSVRSRCAAGAVTHHLWQKCSGSW